MGCEARTDVEGDTKHDLWGPNVKTGEYLPRANFLYFLRTIGVMLCVVNQLELFFM